MILLNLTTLSTRPALTHTLSCYILLKIFLTITKSNKLNKICSYLLIHKIKTTYKWNEKQQHSSVPVAFSSTLSYNKSSSGPTWGTISQALNWPSKPLLQNWPWDPQDPKDPCQGLGVYVHALMAQCCFVGTNSIWQVVLMLMLIRVCHYFVFSRQGSQKCDGNREVCISDLAKSETLH